MNQDQDPYGGNHRGPASGALLNVLVALALVLLGSAVSMPAASATTNGGGSAIAWPAHWNAYAYEDGTPIGDVNDDMLPSYLDLASGACTACAGPAPSVAFTSDGANAFFRLRLATDITDVRQHGSFGGAFLVQIAGANGQPRAVVGVDGTDPAHHDVYVADSVGGVVTKVHEPKRSAGSRARVIAADDGSGQFFLDFQVPISLIAAVSGGAVTASTPIKLYAGSSAATDLAPVNLATINSDFMLGNDAAVDFSALATVRLVPLQYPVAFDSAGGSAVPSQSVTEGSPVAAPATPTRTGHTFSGWYTRPSAGWAYDFGTAVTGATTVYAQWTRTSYPVTFDSAGGSAVAGQAVLYGGTVVMPTDPTRDDSTFLGWFPAARGGKAFDPATQPVTAATALYAHWRGDGAPGPPVTPDAVGSSAVGPHPVLRSDPAAALPSAPSGSVENFTTPVAGATTVHTQAARSTYSVVFYPNGGSAVASQTVTAGDTASVPTEPTRAGYTFAGWFATADGGAAWDFTSSIDDATTLYAHWTALEDDGAGDPNSGSGDPDSGSGDPDSGSGGPDSGSGGPDGEDTDGGGDQGVDTAGDQAGGDNEGDQGVDTEGGSRTNGGATLPNTGNQVPAAVLPGAAMMLLLGLVLMTRDHRRLETARDPE